MPVTINRRFTVLKRLPKPTEGGRSEEALFKFEIEVNESWFVMKKEITLGETKMLAVSPYTYLLDIGSWNNTQTVHTDSITLANLKATIDRSDLFPEFKTFLDSGSGDYPLDY